jgi:hypothetical protein
MSERKWRLIEVDPPYEISWAEKRDIAFHCLRWREENRNLTEWLASVRDDDVVVHVAGENIAQDVVTLDMEKLIEVDRRSPSPEDIADAQGFQIVVYLSKSEALRIAREGKDGPVDIEETRRASVVYADVMKPRFRGEPFVYLTCGERTLPIKVNLI